jgi:hypothetical protein
VTWLPQPLPPLTAPVWGKQPEETPQAYDAFLAWLCGGTKVRDWVAAAKAAGTSLELTKTIAQRWVWEVRAQEWIKASRRVSIEAMAPMRDELVALTVTRLRAHRAALELEALELEKMLAKAKGELATGAAALPSTLDARELAAIRRVNVQANDALRREADGLPPADDGKAPSRFDDLSPDELEHYRKLRDKAGVVG